MSTAPLTLGKRARANWPLVHYEHIQLKGGLDLVTPTLSLKPGVARDAVNFEATTSGGYRRIAGYERYDGRPEPSEATFTVLTIPVPLAGALVVGNAVDHGSNSATGTVAYINGGDVVITKVVGTWAVGETVRNTSNSYAPVGKVGSIATAVGDLQLDATYTAAAADRYRADIGQVGDPTASTGNASGPVHGVGYLAGVVYAFRNNLAGTATTLWKSSSSGWTAVTMLYEVAFKSATAAPAEGATFTQGANSATVKRVVLESGAYAGGTAAGRLIVTVPTPGAFVAGVVGALTLDAIYAGPSPQRQITIAPNVVSAAGNSSHYETILANFTGSATTLRMYGVSGVDYAFEFDGTTYVPIHTGMTTDHPTHIIAHKYQLVLSFGPSVQNSSPGLPYVWTPITGAAEVSLGENVTGFLVQPGNQGATALAVFSESNTWIYYNLGGTDPSLVPFNFGVGALPYTTQNMVNAYGLDHRGVTNLAATINFGNFDQSTLTFPLQPFVQAHRPYAIESCVSHEKSQYRVFYSDGWGLYVTVFNDKLVGSMPVFFPNAPTCMVRGDNFHAASPIDVWFGAANGYVYHLDHGTSFDGAPIGASLTLVYNAAGSPRLLKRYRRASLEITGSSYVPFQLGYNLGYGTSEIAQPAPAVYAANFHDARWDSYTWDSFVWDGVTLSPSECEMTGTGENIALTFLSSSAISDSFTVNSAILHYSIRRGLR